MNELTPTESKQSPPILVVDDKRLPVPLDIANSFNDSCFNSPKLYYD